MISRAKMFQLLQIKSNYKLVMKINYFILISLRILTHYIYVKILNGVKKFYCAKKLILSIIKVNSCFCKKDSHAVMTRPTNWLFLFYNIILFK